MEIARCKECGSEGIKVLPITLGTHLKEKHWKSVDSGFYFCPSLGCEVVYFNNSSGIYFRKKDIKTRVGIKERNEPKPLCYCSRVTEKDLINALENFGSVEEAVEATGIGKGKWCVVTNPSGRCCEWYLKEYLKDYSRKVRRKGKIKKIRLKLSGLTCAGCVSVVKAALENVGAEIRKITMDEVEIMVEDENAEKYITAIKSAGYNAEFKG